ncbi:MAG TPA: hypothetical protein ENI97_10000 [Gammaproteobacteria bacterium]|nr:hypothetical protein [Gammaproteobacteria bacterium]
MQSNAPPHFDNPPPWVRWLAQDADGSWWGFEAEPHHAEKSWYENEVGRYRRLGAGAANPQWRETLQRRQV